MFSSSSQSKSDIFPGEGISIIKINCLQQSYLFDGNAYTCNSVKKIGQFAMPETC